MNNNERFIVIYEENELTMTKPYMSTEKPASTNFSFLLGSGALTPLLNADGKPVVTEF